MWEGEYNHDWKRAKRMYLKGDKNHLGGYTFAEIERELNIPESTLYKRSKADKWREEKEEIIDRSNKRVARNIVRDLAIENTDRIKKLSAINTGMLNIAIELLEDATDGTMEEKMKVLKALQGTTGMSNVLKDLHLLLGEPTEIKEKRFVLPNNWKELPADELDKYIKKTDIIETTCEVEDE